MKSEKEGLMRKTQILTNLKTLDCCEVHPSDKLIYFPTDQCKLKKSRDSLKIHLCNRGARLIAISPLQNSAGPYQMHKNAAYNQDFHCLHTSFYEKYN